ncbi:MAG: DUF1735 domain-containing protein, partial [Flavobacteriales bacterium]
AALVAVATLSSCLKDDRLVLDPEKGTNVIEFVNPGQINHVGSTTALYVLSYPVSSTLQVIPLEVSYSGPADGAPEDIVVNLAVGGQAIIDQYNEEQDEDYTLMPTSWYSVGATSVTIPKGQKRATFNVSINTSLFDLTKPYVVPMTITSVSSGTVSTNFSKILLNFGAKNPIDGLYNLKTTATTSLVPNANFNNVPLVTSGPNTVTTNLLDTYANIMVYRVDFTTNKVTVVSGLGTPVTDPVSNWNPTTKVLYAKWTSGARSFEETFTYQGVR